MTVRVDNTPPSELIGRVMAAEERLREHFFDDRCNPLLSVNLTMQQLKVLLLLMRHDAIATHELTSKLGVSMATVTGLLDRLAAHDYVTRQEDPGDRRVRRLSLTPAGRRVGEEILDAGARHQRRLLERLDDETLVMLETALIRLNAAAIAEAAELPERPAVE